MNACRLALLSAGLLIAGCSKSPSIVGTWHEGKAPRYQPDVGFTFRSDGTYDGWYRTAYGNATDTGTYRLDGDRLTLTQLTHTSSFGTPASTKPQFRTVKWLSADQLEFSSGSLLHEKMTRETSN